MTDEEMLKAASEDRPISREELGIKYPTTEDGFNILPDGLFSHNTNIWGEDQEMRKEDIPYFIAIIISCFVGTILGTFIANVLF